MKRFLLFHGHVYYPRGGWEDFKGSYGSIEEADSAFTTQLEDWEEPGRFVWYHIVDSSTWLIVKGS